VRTLLIEDDRAAARTTELLLTTAGFNVYVTDEGEEGVELAKLYDYDIILLDLNLPDMDGFDVLRSLRQARIETPIMIVSGTAGIDAKVKTLSVGADDYMTKPFHKDELVARIHAIARRARGHSESVIRTGQLAVNIGSRTVEMAGQPLHVTSREFQILELLSLRKGTTVTKQMFMNHLYGGLHEPELKIIDVFICKLRRKMLEATKGERHIETVWGGGYMLREPSPVLAAA
jgi:two-component system cell cycle response regulator CtrA